MSKDLTNVGSAGLSGVTENLPAPLQSGFLHVASRMLGGLVAYPAAWLRRPLQGFEDTTDARTIVSKGLAEAYVEQAKQDPTVMEAVAQAYLPDAVRKIRNKASILRIAEEELAKPDEAVGCDGEIDPPDEDWINTFIRPSEDASSERLQNFLGKMLAGEIRSPGKFSKSTVRLLSELDSSAAKSFELFNQRAFELGTVLRDNDFRRGQWWSRLSELRNAGLILPNDAVLYSPPGALNWSLGSGPVLMIEYDRVRSEQIPIISYTKEGCQIASLLPSKPDYRANLRIIAESLGREGLKSVVMLGGSSQPELLWPKA